MPLIGRKTGLRFDDRDAGTGEDLRHRGQRRETLEPLRVENKVSHVNIQIPVNRASIIVII